MQQAVNRRAILVVDDEEFDRKLVQYALKPFDHAILEAKNASDAIRVYEANSAAIDLVITDVKMPGMNGVELANELKMHQPALKVLFMSGFSTIKEIDPDLFIQKGFDLEQLAQKVARALNLSLEDLRK